jgi:protein-histidine pros-kinase
VYSSDAVNLLVKFNILLILVFGSGLGAAAVISRQSLQADARAETVRQAALMMETMLSARNYTTKQIQPLLVKQQEHQKSFLPQTVPAFAATENFLHLQASYPDYAYKEATLNPTNLRDRAVDWETDIINTFRNRKEVKELVGERDTPTGKSLYLARPIKANPPCLECHSTPAEAPPALVRHYGANNGFGWQEGEIIGAQIVSVPMAVPFKMADEAFQRLMIGLSAVFAASLIVLDLALLFTVVRPLRKISAMADQISLGQMDLPELNVRGRDEIAVLASSFTRMRRSLERALSMLEG